jgi:hypothetical protein
MSNTDSSEHLQRLGSEDVSQEEREILLRNTTHDPLRMIVGTCRLLLHGELGGLSEKQVEAVRRILKYAESVEKVIDLHLEMQGITVGRQSGKQD